MKRAASRAACGGLGLALLVTSSVEHAFAVPGAHPEAVSTYDTRSSSVVLAYRHGLLDGASRVLSYNANFTATSGNFSAQFGAHYLQLEPDPGVRLLHGAAASGTALFSIPLGSRYDNAVPSTALALYVGAVPTAAVNGRDHNFLNVPLTLGFGFPLSPAASVTLTPWFEAAPTLSLDSQVSEADFSNELRNQTGQFDPDDELELTEQQVRAVLSDGIDLEVNFHFTTRAGLQAILHAGESWDFNFYGSIATQGSVFRGDAVGHVGLGLAYHWDDLVDALRPTDKRTAAECAEVSTHYQECAARGAFPPTASPPPQSATPTRPSPPSRGVGPPPPPPPFPPAHPAPAPAGAPPAETAPPTPPAPAAPTSPPPPAYPAPAAPSPPPSPPAPAPSAPPAPGATPASGPPAP